MINVDDFFRFLGLTFLRKKKKEFDAFIFFNEKLFQEIKLKFHSSSVLPFT